MTTGEWLLETNGSEGEVERSLVEAESRISGLRVYLLPYKPIPSGGPWSATP